MIRLNIIVKPLVPGDSLELSRKLLKSSVEYNRYFIPFPFDFDSVKKALEMAYLDKYYGIFVENEIAGFYMLRGFDSGYEIPSYGVWISEQYSGMGLAALTIQHAISFCRINGIKKIMLKVHESNSAAKHLYEKYGFEVTGYDEKIGQIVYHKKI